MIKTFAQMNTDERRLSQIGNHLRTPENQFKILQGLNAGEFEIVEKGTTEDVVAMRRRAAREGKPFHERESESDWLYGNGHNNMRRIAERRDVSLTKLYLDFALPLGLLRGQSEHRELSRIFVGEYLGGPFAAIVFAKNVLTVNGKEVLTVKSSTVTKLDHILLSFEEINWREGEEVDFRKRFSRTAVKDAVVALNRKAKETGNAITFSSSGTEIRWRMNKSN